MARSSIALAAVVAAALGAVAIPGSAADQKEVYVSPGSDRKPLFRGPLHGMESHDIAIDQFTFPPGWVGGKHYHTGPVFVYIIEGEFGVTEKGRGDQAFQPGALYREPVGIPMQARNLSGSRPLKVLLIQVGRKGEPLMIKSD